MILVVGATGALGGAITRDLLARGHRVRGLVRPGSHYATLEHAGMEPVLGDLKQPESVARACSGARVVISTANSAARGGEDTVQSVDRVGNRILIDAARSAGVEHFIFVSAIGADEESPVDFFRAKGETESYLKASGMAYTILQPNLFMESWIGMIVGMPLSQGVTVTLVEPATHRHTFVSARDVAAFAVAAVTNAAARNRTLLIGGPQALSWRDVVAAAERVTERRIDVRFVAPGEPLPGLPELVSHMAAGFESYESAFDTTTTATEFGVQLTPVDQYLSECLSSGVAAT